MKVSVYVEVGAEEVESLAQSLETCSDETMKGFVEQVLTKVHEHSESVINAFETIEKVNPFSMSKRM